MRDVRRTGGGRGLCREQGKEEWMECFLVDFRAFSINADQWMTAVQVEVGWRKTAENSQVFGVQY